VTPKASTQQWESQYSAMLGDWNLFALAISQSCTAEAKKSLVMLLGCNPSFQMSKLP
jgi:hypothetical protein